MSVRQSINRVRQVVRKEFAQLFRDPRMIRFLIGPPLIQLIIFGYAVSTDIRHTPTFIVDQDLSLQSRELVEKLTASGYFRVVGQSRRAADLVHALDHGDALLGLEIPAGFAAALAGNESAQVQLLLDGTNSNTAMTARGYAERIITRYGLDTGPIAISVPVDLRQRAWYNPNLLSRNYNVPGVVVVLLLILGLILTALAVVREREIGTLEQLMVSPLKPGELIAGKTIPFAIIGLFDLTLITTLALLWFGVPFKGNFLFLFGSGVLYLLSVLGIGLLISTISRTQQEAFMAGFLFIMPAILLSGFMFPVTSMPPVFQYLTLLNPLRHFLEIVRGIFLKGAGPATLWPQCLGLILIGGGVLILAATRFRKTMA
ncbi:ABC transporter permease [Candidatus Zixiibacteriota bacterium]